MLGGCVTSKYCGYRYLTKSGRFWDKIYCCCRSGTLMSVVNNTVVNLCRYVSFSYGNLPWNNTTSAGFDMLSFSSSCFVGGRYFDQYEWSLALPPPGGRNICGCDWGKNMTRGKRIKEKNVKEKQKIKGKLKWNAYENTKGVWGVNFCVSQGRKNK
jgi:hypothetical protein